MCIKILFLSRNKQKLAKLNFCHNSAKLIITKANSAIHSTLGL